MADDAASQTAEKVEEKPEEKPDEKVEKLKATVNRRIDSLGNENKALREEVKSFRTKVAEVEGRESALAAEREALKLAEEPEKLLERFNQVVKELDEARSSLSALGPRALDYGARGRAAEVLASMGSFTMDELDRLTKKFSRADSEDRLEEMVEEAKAELPELKALLAAKAETSGSEIDTGTGASGRKPLVTQILQAGEDPYSPEAQKQWADSREKLRSQLPKG